MRNDKRDRVIFRKWHERDGDVIAVLPDVDSNQGSVWTYMHVGQGGEADYWHILQVTRLATPEEYASLLEELKQQGHDLKVVKRLNRGE